MGSNNHTCRACGGHYFACDACDQRLGKSWRAMYCCEEHRQAYQDMIAYVRGTITKAQAKEALEKYGAQDWTESTSYPTICEIFEANAAEEPAKEEIVEEAPVEEAPVAEEAAEEPKAEEKAEEVEEAFVTGIQVVEEKAPVEAKTTYAASNGWNKNGWNNNYKGKKRR